MRTATLLLVGPNKLSRAGLRSLFQDSPFTVVGEASDAAGIAALCDGGLRETPDIALIEGGGGPDCVLALLDCLNTTFPDMPVVVLNDMVCVETLAACLAAGAGGFLTRDISSDALFGSLKLAVLGEIVFPTSLAAMLAGSVRRPQPAHTRGGNECGLSGREVETLQCLLRGESNKVIAKRLEITEATIKVHIKSVLRKIKATNRTQAAIWAHGRGYLPAGDATPGQFSLD